MLLASLASQAAPGHSQLFPPLENGPGMRLTREMDAQINLLEHQFIRLLPLNRQHLAERAAVSYQCGTDAAVCRERLDELDLRYEEQYRSFLYTRQLIMLAEMHGALAPDTSFGFFLSGVLHR